WDGCRTGDRGPMSRGTLPRRPVRRRRPRVAFRLVAMERRPQPWAITPDECSAQGATQCSGTRIQTCVTTADADPCREWSPPTVCPHAGETCVNDACLADPCATGSCPLGCSSGTGQCLSAALFAYLKAANSDSGDEFGNAVALSADGNTLAVAAHGEDGSAVGVNGNPADNAAQDSGAVYVFIRTGGTWTQQAYLKASNTGAPDHFGTHVALSADGNTLAVGATLEDSAATGVNGNQADNTASASGAAYVFTRTAGTWTQQAYLKASNTNAIDYFGALALSADGNTLAVGAPEEDSNATGVQGNQSNNDAWSSGAVYVFTRSGVAWAQQAYLKASNTDSNDQFGWSVALAADGNTVAVGAYGEASGATGINANQVDNSQNGAGAAYVFTRAGGVWTQQAYLKATNTDAMDHFGVVVALAADGNTLAVVADWEDSAATGFSGNQVDNSVASSGAVYVFTRTTAGPWTAPTYVKASNTDVGDEFGTQFALSADGRTLAVGAAFEDSAATGINGIQSDNTALASGATYVFSL
ncbi:MAG: hypothetical protein HY904_16650, partial [Deltaproteobacteria bacterium]|nr:hypothetical protein [Deltaproteobacteria bacterium]